MKVVVVGELDHDLNLNHDHQLRVHSNANIHGNLDKD